MGLIFQVSLLISMIVFLHFRNIILKNCLSINRRTDTKHKYVIALFWGTECFGIVHECEDDLQEWLRLLLIHYQGEDIVDINYPKPYYGE